MDDALYKIAAQLYSNMEAAKRNYTPRRSTIQPRLVKLDTGTIVSHPTIPGNVGDVPKLSANKNADPNGYATWCFTHPFTPTVSGTGSGQQYWTLQRNPYES